MLETTAGFANNASAEPSQIAKSVTLALTVVRSGAGTRGPRAVAYAKHRAGNHGCVPHPDHRNLPRRNRRDKCPAAAAAGRREFERCSLSPVTTEPR